MSGRVTREDGIEVERIEPSDLEEVFVVPQVLDNQWVPPSMLRKMVKRGLALSDVQRPRNMRVRTEYIRSLTNSKQVVINRAFLYNNPAVFRDYLTPGKPRDAFKELLRRGVILPFLFSEQTPIPAKKPKFSVDSRGFSAWRELCQETRLRCVRLSWNEETNYGLIQNQLARRFHLFAMGALAKDTAVFRRELGLRPDAEDLLRKRLAKMTFMCADVSMKRELVTREQLYKAFVTAGDTPAEGKYDSSKPLAAELKQLLDLSYNVNLADALGGYALTPIGSLPRTALQEWEEARREREIEAQELADLLRRLAFDQVEEGLYLRSPGSLNLHQVLEARATDEWLEYMQCLEKLLAEPLEFADRQKGAPAVYRSYVNLIRTITRLTAGPRCPTEKWAPGILLMIYIGGARLMIEAMRKGWSYEEVGAVSPMAAAAAPLVVRLIVRGASYVGRQANQTLSVDVMRRRMRNARKQWKELLARVSELPDFERARPARPRGQDPLINYREEPNERHGS